MRYSTYCHQNADSLKLYAMLQSVPSLVYPQNQSFRGHHTLKNHSMFKRTVASLLGDIDNAPYGSTISCRQDGSRSTCLCIHLLA